MTDDALRRSIFWISVLVCTLFVGFLGLRGIARQQELAEFKRHRIWGKDLIKSCSPGQRVEFVVGSVSLYVDVHWSIDLPAFIDVPGPITDCPTMPLKVPDVYFRRPTGVDIPHAIHADGVRLHEKFRAPNYDPYDPTNGDPLSATPWVEDKTPVRVRDRSPDARWYGFHYRDGDQASDATPVVSCGDKAGRSRNCESFQIVAGLGVRYQLFQTELPIPNGAEVTSTDPNTEPGALLLFDQRLRNWIRGLERKPARN